MKYLDKKKVKDALTISEIVEKYSPKYRVKGKAIFFLCPFHDDHNLGSCYSYLDAHYFTCSACREKADVLKLASQYTDIPLNNMNQLLEKLVQDFGLIREYYTQDADLSMSSAKKNVVPTLSDEEYQLLTGIAFIRTPAKTEDISVGGNVQKITTKYNWTYLRTLAKRDASAYEFEIITRSRIIWKKLSELAKKVETDSSVSKKISRLLEISMLSEQTNAHQSHTASALKVRKSIPEIMRAMIADNEELLKKSLSATAYEEEMAIRRQLGTRMD